MKKNKIGEDNEENKYKNTKVDKYQNTRDLYNVVFKQNRKFEIKIGREFLIFEGGKVNPVYPDKYKDGLPKAMIDNKDFQSQVKYFTVTKK